MRVKCPNCKLYVEYDNDDFITDDSGRTGIECIFCNSLIELEPPQKSEVVPAAPVVKVTPEPKPEKAAGKKVEEKKSVSGEQAPKPKKPRKKPECKKKQTPLPPAPSPEPEIQPQQNVVVAEQEGCTNGQCLGCLSLMVLIIALAGYFFNWWGLPFLPDRGGAEAMSEPAIEPVAENVEVIFDQPSESQLINLIQLANKAQTSGITPEFAAVIQQYAYAPNAVWEGGIAKCDFSPELLVEQSELGEVLNVEILNQSYSDDGSHAEILFQYYSQMDDYKSPTHQAIAYIVNDGDSWLVDDFGMDYSQYGGAAYRLSESMKMYTEASNRRILSGETLRDLHLMFGDRPEELNEMLNYVREYARAYDLVIPDSLSYSPVSIGSVEDTPDVVECYYD